MLEMPLKNESRKKILLVDDNKNLLVFISCLFEKSGYRVISCYDGQRAVELFTTMEPDLVIMPILMPNLDGFTACQKMREIQSEKYVPIIITSNTNPKDKHQQEAKRIGADGYLVKPFNFAQLINMVEELLIEKRERRVYDKD